MRQRLEITEKGEILVHTDNGVFDGSKWGSEISGEFTVDALDMGRLLASNTDGIVPITRTYSAGWCQWKEHNIISKEDLFSAHKEVIKEKDNTIGYEVEMNKHLNLKIQCFNALPFWKKMFYKFDV